MVFHWSLSESKSPQVFGTLPSNAAIWIVSTRLSTFESPRPFNNPLVIVPKAPITIGIIVTLMFHSFFNSLARSTYLSFFSHSFSFILWSAGTDQRLLMIFHWSLSDSNSPQVSRTLLNILADINNAVLDGLHLFYYFWVFQSLYKSFGDCTKSTDYNYKRHFHVPVFFVSQARSKYVSFFSLSFSFALWSAETAKSTTLHAHCFFVLFCFVLFLLIITRSARLTEIKWSVWMSKSQWSLRVSCSRGDVGLCIYHLFIWSNRNFWHISQWITLPTQPYLVLYSFLANLLHSLIIWIMVSSLSPHNLHLLFCCVLSILALIWLVFIVLF